MNRGGAFVDGVHRYHLWRAWEARAPSVCWIMLNPSIADASVDDPTVRKCVGFSKRWGFGSIDVLNLYTYRATSPNELRRAGYPNGEFADAVIKSVLGEYTDRVVYGWGTKARRDRAAVVDGLVRSLGFEPMALKLCRDGQPAHPLYLPYEMPPLPFAMRQPAAAAGCP